MYALKWTQILEQLYIFVTALRQEKGRIMRRARGVGRVTIRELVVVENIRLICMLDLTTDFEFKTIRQVTHQISAERERANLD